ncbi:hypothetical protein PENTCL1PPCAC_22227, partial [Pristionchus entomophagus]
LGTASQRASVPTMVHYTNEEERTIVEALYRLCSSKDESLRELALQHRKRKVWMWIEKELGGRSWASMQDRYRKYLHEKIHHVGGISVETVLYIYKYIGTVLPTLERQNIMKMFPNYHVV